MIGTRMCAAAVCVLCSACAIATPRMPPPTAVVAAKFAAVNRHSIADIVQLYSPDADVNASDFCAPRHGRAEVARTYQALFSAVPDVVVDVDAYFVQGDQVIVRMTVRSRVPGQSFDIPIANFFLVRNGLIERDEGYFDNHGRTCSP
jgi:ketosteroid isomerase-like protein